MRRTRNWRRHYGFNRCLGGRDHKTGQVDNPEVCYHGLETTLRTLLLIGVSRLVSLGYGTSPG